MPDDQSPNYPYGDPDLWTDEEVRATDRDNIVPWDEPVKMYHVFSGVDALGCRLCIARHGIAAENIHALPRTMEEFLQHRKEKHGQ
jgi:hypothetical protein